MPKNIFNSIRLSKPKKNVFDLTHDVKLSFNMGELIPVMCTPTIPGDKFNISGETLLRFSPLIAPIMHRMDISIHYFFVPNRILWPNWEKFLAPDANQTPINHPYITMGDGNWSRLADYLGIPKPNPATPTYTTENISPLPFAAYQKIFNEYYRDQNLISEVDYLLSDGDNTTLFNSALRNLRRRCWEHDYFTSALPWAQKGSSVDIPLGLVELIPDTGPGIIRKAQETQTTLQGDVQSDGSGAMLGGNPQVEAVYDPAGSLQVSPTTVTDLRRAMKLQEWLERNARGGTRYIEHILAHFGVKSSDKRLQRPEYITGVKSPVVISEVLNTTGTQDAPQGQMAGHAIGVASGKYGSYFCEEHGYIIGICSVMPKTAYMDGIPKHFLKITDPYEHYYPTFAHIGEQPVWNRELKAFHSSGSGVFGYVPRYAEYKFEPNRVAGDFRDSLDFWTLARKFDNMPSLNQTFVECQPDEDRVFAVIGEQDQRLFAQVLNKVTAVRPMPKFGNPML